MREMMEEGEELEPPVFEPSPIDDLIEELIEQGEARFTREQLTLCQTHREDAVPALTDAVIAELE